MRTWCLVARRPTPSPRLSRPLTVFLPPQPESWKKQNIVLSLRAWLQEVAVKQEVIKANYSALIREKELRGYFLTTVGQTVIIRCAYKRLKSCLNFFFLSFQPFKLMEVKASNSVWSKTCRPQRRRTFELFLGKMVSLKEKIKVYPRIPDTVQMESFPCKGLFSLAARWWFNVFSLLFIFTYFCQLHKSCQNCH